MVHLETLSVGTCIQMVHANLHTRKVKCYGPGALTSSHSPWKIVFLHLTDFRMLGKVKWLTDEVSSGTMVSKKCNSNSVYSLQCDKKSKNCLK